MVCLTQFAVSFLAAGVVAPPVFWIHRQVAAEKEGPTMNDNDQAAQQDIVDAGRPATTNAAPLAQLRDADEDLWRALTVGVAAPGVDPVRQALAAALLGDVALAREILDGAIWRYEWPRLAPAPADERRAWCCVVCGLDVYAESFEQAVDVHASAAPYRSSEPHDPVWEDRP